MTPLPAIGSERRTLYCRFALVGITVFLLQAGSVLPARSQILEDMTDAPAAVGTPNKTTLGKVERWDFDVRSPGVEYTGVAFSAFTNDEAAQGWVRFREGSEWTQWFAMHLVRSATGGFVMGGRRGPEVRASMFEFRFEVAAGRTLSIVGAGVFDNRKDEDRDGPSKTAGGARATGPATITVDPPPLITRSEWDAEPFIGTPVPLADPTYNYMTFHHAAGFSATSREEGIAQVKAIQDLHQNVRGWSDIGYQFVVDRGGRLYQGRPFLDASTTLAELPALARGAHVGGFNTGNIGICLLGCYHPPEGFFCSESITPEAYDTYVESFAFLGTNYGIDPGLIRGHRDFSSTACPGDNNYSLLCSGPLREPACSGPQLRVDVQNLLSTGVIRPDELTLAQSFPNPVSGRATLDYYLTEDGVVTLKVFDSIGREVDTLVGEFQAGDRWYTAGFEARRVSAGTYFVRLQVLGVGNKKLHRSSTLTVVH